MIVGFYGLYVFLTPVNFSWLWFLIALMLNVLSYIGNVLAIIEREKHLVKPNNNYWKGDE